MQIVNGLYNSKEDILRAIVRDLDGIGDAIGQLLPEASAGLTGKELELFSIKYDVRKLAMQYSKALQKHREYMKRLVDAKKNILKGMKK